VWSGRFTVKAVSVLTLRALALRASRSQRAPWSRGERDQPEYECVLGMLQQRFGLDLTATNQLADRYAVAATRLHDDLPRFQVAAIVSGAPLPSLPPRLGRPQWVGPGGATYKPVPLERCGRTDLRCSVVGVCVSC
jgi:hypothetical protein